MDGANAERRERARIKDLLKKNMRTRQPLRSRGVHTEQQARGSDDALTNENAQRDPQSEAIFAKPMRYDESRLLMHYLDSVFPLQYPYYPFSQSGGRGWLLWLLSKNGSLMRASLGLAALHLRHTDQAVSESPNMELEYLTSVLRELREAIALWTTTDAELPDAGLVEVVAAGAALITFEVGSLNSDPVPSSC